MKTKLLKHLRKCGSIIIDTYEYNARRLFRSKYFEERADSNGYSIFILKK